MMQEDTRLLNADVPELPTRASRLWDFVKEFVWLGLVSFGGPQSHIAILRHDVVETRRWLSPPRFAELFALCSAIPGPSSSQLVTAVAMARLGWMGGLLGYFLFLVPGFIIMLTLGSLAGIYSTDQWYLQILETGLSLGGLTLVGSNAMALGTSLCKHTLTRVLCALVVCISMWFNAYWWIFPSLFGFCALCTLVFFTVWPNQLAPPEATEGDDKDVAELGYGKLVGGLILLFNVSVLVTLIVLSTQYADVKLLGLAEVFYRIGATIFGGGNVILAMFLTELVQPGLISSHQFFVGYALVNALPGPVFNFALYLGAVIGGPFVGVMCWVCLNWPGISLVYALTPFWQLMRRSVWFRRLNAGLNACGVGLIIQAYISIFFTIVGVSAYRVVLHVFTWSTLLIFDAKPHAVILLGGATGGLYGTALHYMNITL